MTPTAATPAARTKQGAGSRPPRSSSPHPSTPRPAHRAPRASTAAPVAPRRVSGPGPVTPGRKAERVLPENPVRTPRPGTSGPRRSAATTRTAPERSAPVRTARARSVPARTTRTATPRTPRRVSGGGEAPVRRLTRALAVARSLPDHSLLDRIVRGRLWIPLLGVLLIGIVASQVEILKLNASLGQGIVRAAALQSADQRLANTVSQLSDVQRIEQKAAQMGLSMPAAYLPIFLSGGRGELRRALANIHRPDPAAFEARVAALAAHRATLVQTTSGA
jgi:hypothetical protein